MLEKIPYYYDKKPFARIPEKNIVIGTLMTKRRKEQKNVQVLNAGR